jgi:hypothetical protein
LAELCQKSFKEANKVKGSYEAHFNVEFKEATTWITTPLETEMPSLTTDNYMDIENTIIEYSLNDLFGDLN